MLTTISVSSLPEDTHCVPSWFRDDQLERVKSVVARSLRRLFLRKRIKASIADVFPLLFAPTKIVSSCAISMRHAFSFRKFCISMKSICIPDPKNSRERQVGFELCNVIQLVKKKSQEIPTHDALYLQNDPFFKSQTTQGGVQFPGRSDHWQRRGDVGERTESPVRSDYWDCPVDRRFPLSRQAAVAVSAATCPVPGS